MKRLTAFVLTSVLVLTLSACQQRQPVVTDDAAMDGESTTESTTATITIEDGDGEMMEGDEDIDTTSAEATLTVEEADE